jgi:site-specific DNA-methyltransferase (adenine-specific)
VLNQEHIEVMFEYLDQSASLLQTEMDWDYIKALHEAVLNACESSVLQDISLQGQKKLEDLLTSIKQPTFQKEEIRKAMQLVMLKGLKELGISNQVITPDTVGIFLAYLIEKFIQPEQIRLLDPLAGSGNLLATIEHALDKKVEIFGVEASKPMFSMLQSLFAMLDEQPQLFFQDTMTYLGEWVDCLVMDFSKHELTQERYFPYEVLLHHHQNLKPAGFVFSVIFDDFFDHVQSNDFRQLIQEKYSVIGLIKLPSSMFKRFSKSILILQKQGPTVKKIEKALIVELPDFQDESSSRTTISHINQWITENMHKGEHKNG